MTSPAVNHSPPPTAALSARCAAAVRCGATPKLMSWHHRLSIIRLWGMLQHTTTSRSRCISLGTCHRHLLQRRHLSQCCNVHWRRWSTFTPLTSRINAVRSQYSWWYTNTWYPGLTMHGDMLRHDVHAVFPLHDTLRYPLVRFGDRARVYWQSLTLTVYV